MCHGQKRPICLGFGLTDHQPPRQVVLQGPSQVLEEEEPADPWGTLLGGRESIRAECPGFARGVFWVACSRPAVSAVFRVPS